MKVIEAFKNPIYITRPLLPDLSIFTESLKILWENKWLSNNGIKVRELEEKLKNYLNVDYISAINNGTTALMIACKALELRGNVITTQLTFPATINILKWLGIEPIFCDIDSITLNIDTNKIEEMINKKTTGILAVHLFGNPCNMVKIDEIAKKNNLKVIYDASHCFGEKIGEKGIGSFGDISIFSFHVTKLFHTIEGGAICCKNKNFKYKVDLMRNFGIENENKLNGEGINGKMNELQAIIGILLLENIEYEIKKRFDLSLIYNYYLSNIDGINPQMKTQKNVKYNYQYYPIIINKKKLGKSRDEIYDGFKKYNIFTKKFFYNSNILLLPLYGELENNGVEKICQIFLSLIGENN